MEKLKSWIMSVAPWARPSAKKLLWSLKKVYVAPLQRCEWLRVREAEFVIRRTFKKFYGRALDENKPVTFSEKLYCRMLMVNRNGNAEFERLADKFRVREFVRDRIGEEYLTTLLWHGKDPNQIPFECLPPKFVIKTNHGSGGNIIVKGHHYHKRKVQIELERLMNSNFYWEAREYQYYNIVPRILVEEFIDDPDPSGLLDYRIFCFEGCPEVIQVDNLEHGINPFYDSSWRKLNLSYRKCVPDIDLPMPKRLDQMLEVARKLSAGFSFVRVDLYNVDGRIKFGEMTFTPVAGRFEFDSEAWDLILGNKWKGRYG